MKLLEKKELLKNLLIEKIEKLTGQKIELVEAIDRPEQIKGEILKILRNMNINFPIRPTPNGNLVIDSKFQTLQQQDTFINQLKNIGLTRSVDKVIGGDSYYQYGNPKRNCYLLINRKVSA